jgi:hypothetical protein
MVFNDTTDEKQGIVQDIYFGVSANNNTYPIGDLTRDANRGLDMAVSMILGADGRWQFDSTNATDLPIGFTNIVSGQQDYSFDDEYLMLAKPLQVLHSDGVTWIELVPSDDNDLISSNGIPARYNKMGESFLLDPIPNYSATNGLKAFFQRKIDYFTTTDTTKEPGFAKHLHKFISLYCQASYARAKGLAKLAQLEKDLMFYTGNELNGGNDVGEFKRFYSYREKDQEKRLTMNNRVHI